MRGECRFFWLMAGTALLTGGCARSIVTTEVKPDGSWTRTITFRGQAPNEKEGAIKIGKTLQDIFVLPTPTAWKITREEKENELIYTAARSLPAGEMVRHDIVLKGKGKEANAPLLVNEVRVRQVEPGKWEYREVLHWNGERPDDLLNVDAQKLALLKQSLPAALATDENARAVTHLVVKEVWRMLFGPGDPLLSQLLMHPDLAERRILRRVGLALEAALEKQFGDRMTAPQRRETARKIMAQLDTVEKLRGQAKAKANGGPPGEDGGEAGPIPLAFVVKMPGKVLDTNGEVDEVRGEVFWALYSEAAAMEDVVLYATVEVAR